MSRHMVRNPPKFKQGDVITLKMFKGTSRYFRVTRVNPAKREYQCPLYQVMKEE